MGDDRERELGPETNQFSPSWSTRQKRLEELKDESKHLDSASQATSTVPVLNSVLLQEGTAGRFFLSIQRKCSYPRGADMAEKEAAIKGLEAFPCQRSEKRTDRTNVFTLSPGIPFHNLFSLPNTAHSAVLPISPQFPLPLLLPALTVMESDILLIIWLIHCVGW